MIVGACVFIGFYLQLQGCYIGRNNEIINLQVEM